MSVAEPDEADSLHHLGLIAEAAGQPDQALAYVRKACAAPGAKPVYYSNLAEMCRRAGFLAEGERAARQAVALQPDLSGAWNNFGIILQEAGDYAQSKACLLRVLALTPESPEAHNNLANTCKLLCEPVEAERHWLRALELREDYPEPHSNLASLLTDLGLYDRAAYHARQAIRLAPRFADAYINQAQVESARGNQAACLAVLDRLLGFAPGHAVAMSAKALALRQLDRLGEAQDWAQRAVALAPQNAEVRQAAGQVSQALGHFEAACAAYLFAARQPGPIAEKATSAHALLLMEQGKSEDAAHAFDAALKRYPRSAPLFFNRGDLKRFTSAADPDIAAMQALLEPGVVASEHDRMLLRFALGNAFLQLGDSAQAFAHLDEGNRMKRATFSYDSDATARWLANIVASAGPETLARLSGPCAVPGATPLFVIGMPRSGTTLVEQILASHPSVFGAGELHFVADVLSAVGTYPGCLASLPNRSAPEIGKAYLDLLQRHVGADIFAGHAYVIDKMPANFLHAGFLHAMLPQARIIHCVRDPVDTCLSCYSKLFTQEQYFTYNQTELGQFHRSYQGLMAHWRGLLPPSHFLQVTYENVVSDLEGEIRRMLAFLALPWSAECMGFHRTARPVRTASVNQVRQPIYGTSAGRWRPHADHLGPLLKALEA